MDDVRAVMDAVGSERAALFGYSEGGPMCVLFAATYPERTRALVLYGTYAKRLPERRLPVGADAGGAASRSRDELEANWGVNVDISTMLPDADEATIALVRSAWPRASLSPAGARDLILMNSKVDVRELLPSVQCPTLVLHRTGDRDSRVEEGRYIAERIPGARFVELPGDDHVRGSTWTRSLDEVEEFLTGARRAPPSDRVLATVLFTDIVGSTERARAARRRRLDGAARRATTPPCARELARFGGVEVDTAGDGFLALFDGPARAIRCAARDPRRAAAARARHPRRRPHRRDRAGGRRARAGSPSTSPRRVLAAPAPARCSSRRRPTTSSRDPGSSSRTAASTS